MRPIPRLPPLLVLALWLPTAGAAAQGEDGLVGTDATSGDPIGVDRGSDLHRVPISDPHEETPAERARHGPPAPRVRAHAGEVLTAIAAVRELDHRVTVTLADGLARVEVAMRFSNRSRHRAEIAYRLAVPQDAVLADLTVCAAGRCREALEVPATSVNAYDDAVRARGPADAPPIAHAVPVEDDRGSALLLRAAPIERGGELELRIRYTAPAYLSGGVVRIRLPARGTDPRAAPTAITVHAPTLREPTVDGSPATDAPIHLDPWFPAEVVARLDTATPTSATLWRVPCGEQDCVRAHVRAGPRRAVPRRFVLLVDASPSTQGPARGRVAAAVAALLAEAPPGTEVQALAFGARTEVLVEHPTRAGDVRMLPLARAASLPLGPATRFEAAWAVIEPWLSPGERTDPRSLVVLVGDGGLTVSDASRNAFERARRRGIEVSAVSLADRPVTAALAEGVARTGGVVVTAGAEADEAARGRDAHRLAERLASIFAPVAAPRVVVTVGGRRVALGPLRAGEELHFEGRMPRRRALRLRVRGARTVSATVASGWERGLWRMAAVADGVRDEAGAALAALAPEDLVAAPEGTACDPRGPAARAGGVNADATPIALATARSCGPAPEPPAGRVGDHTGRGIPGETVLAMLRQRVVPAARRCFRQDRRGRADYAVHAEFEVSLADREFVSAAVSGRLREPLRRCLLGAVEELEVPRFSGTVVVRYPVYTEREAPPPVIELLPEVARQVDRVAR